MGSGSTTATIVTYQTIKTKESGTQPQLQIRGVGLVMVVMFWPHLLAASVHSYVYVLRKHLTITVLYSALIEHSVALRLNWGSEIISPSSSTNRRNQRRTWGRICVRWPNSLKRLRDSRLCWVPMLIIQHRYRNCWSFLFFFYTECLVSQNTMLSICKKKLH